MDSLPAGITGDTYDRDQITKMCTDAIVQVLKNEGGIFKNRPSTNPKAKAIEISHAIVVEGINQSKVCVVVNEQSCFPKNIEPSQQAIGTSCI
jgi:hypothetical protein